MIRTSKFWADVFGATLAVLITNIIAMFFPPTAATISVNIVLAIASFAIGFHFFVRERVR